jgi:hypothetical protein
MSHRLHRIALLVGIVAMLSSGSSLAALADGLEALKKGDYATAAKELRPLAERGNAEAQYRIGLMYEFGKGFSVDKTRAISWIGKAAAQGHMLAEQELGVIYATGDGAPQDNAQAVTWFRKAAMQGDATAQYNLGLMYAKGTGVKVDNAQAIAWFRKAAAQGELNAQFKMGVAYENGQGVPQDDALAYANYAIAARSGNAQYVEYRDDIARKLDPAKLSRAKAVAEAWNPGKPVPGGDAQGAAVVAASAPPAPDTCSATGTLEGEKFSATNCVVSLYGDQHSVAIWFNEEPITPAEQENFRMSSYADAAKGGKQRTLVQIMFCPGGGAATASPAAVKSIDLNTNHAKSPLAGVQWVLEAPQDIKVQKMSGEVKPGGVLTGKITGGRSKTAFNLEFSVTLPAKDAAAGLTCGK